MFVHRAFESPRASGAIASMRRRNFAASAAISRSSAPSIRARVRTPEIWSRFWIGDKFALSIRGMRSARVVREACEAVRGVSLGQELTGGHFRYYHTL